MKKLNYLKKLSSNPMMSFICPIYNKGIHIKAFYESIAQQDYQNWEIIFVDDGSDDQATKNVLKKLEKKDKVKVLYYDHQGACQMRNYGFAESKGDYISFLPADAVLYPGMLRTWINLLEDNPDYDFVYGGYKFFGYGMDGKFMDHPFLAQEFDPYFLKYYNYIDGSFPLRRKLAEKLEWDTRCRSLQDWEYWLQAVIKHQAKGLWVPEVMFQTIPPQKGGLSDDSSKNWLKRCDYIWNKYGIKVPDICVSSLGAPYHGKHVAKLIGADFKQYPMLKPNRYKMIYLLGFFSANINEHLQVFNNFKGKRVIHWIGTDILQLQNISWQANKSLVEYLNKKIDRHYAEFQPTQEELREVGIKASILPFPVYDDYEVTPLPKEFSVAVYMPRDNQQVYNPELMMQVAKSMPDVQFKFYGDESHKGRAANIQYLGYVKDMKKLIKSTTCLLRITMHDGLPLSVCEFVQAGRHAIFNKKLPFVEYTDGTRKDIIKKIRQVKKLKVNKAGSEHWKKELDKINLKGNYGKT